VSMARRLVITVCYREPGVVVLPVEHGDRARRLDARAIVKQLRSLAERQGVANRVLVREGCAGGCSGGGPNVSVAIYPLPPPGERSDQIAVCWKTYVYSLPALDCLARVIDDNLDEARASLRRPRARSTRPSAPPGC
jgi:hypothetical protein